MRPARFYKSPYIEEARSEFYEAQGGRCAICDERRDRGIVDHCHRNGLIRGLLCNPCNTGLGMFHDSVDKLLGAIAYLRAAERVVAEVEGLDLHGPESSERLQLKSWRIERQRKDQLRADAESHKISPRSDQ